MSTVWLTYAWVDNKNSDVDFVAQELIHEGIQVKLDRWNIGAGRRLWDQIENFIINPEESNAWLIYATQNSLGSEACREEYSYALNRALQERGRNFPIIGLFPASVDNKLIPAGIRTRLYVSLKDPDWKERIKAAAESRVPSINIPEVEPYHIALHSDLNNNYGRKYAIEVRPRAGSWGRFIIGIPVEERDKVNPSILHGPSNHPPLNGILFHSGESISEDGKLWTLRASNEATPTQSYYLFCNNLPSMIAFGDENNPPQKTVNISYRP